MEALSITKKQDRLPLFMAVAAAGMLLFYLFIPVAPLRWHDLYLSYGKTAIVAMAAVYFFCRGFSGTVEIKLVDRAKVLGTLGAMIGSGEREDPEALIRALEAAGEESADWPG